MATEKKSYSSSLAMPLSYADAEGALKRSTRKRRLSILRTPVQPIDFHVWKTLPKEDPTEITDPTDPTEIKDPEMQDPGPMEIIDSLEDDLGGLNNSEEEGSDSDDSDFASEDGQEPDPKEPDMKEPDKVSAVNEGISSLSALSKSISRFLSTNVLNSQKTVESEDASSEIEDSGSEIEDSGSEIEDSSSDEDEFEAEQEKDPILTALTHMHADEKYVQSINISELDIVPDTYLYKFAHFSKDS